MENDAAPTGGAWQRRVVGVPSDHMVNQTPARKLASRIGAEYFAVGSICGHYGTSCEEATVSARVAKFLTE